MHFYETLYLANPNLPEDEYKGLVAKYASTVEKNKGVIIEVAEWGKKTLAYPVKKSQTGFYVLLQYCGDAAVVNGLQHEMRLDERVLKFQTVKLRDNADPEKVKLEKKALKQAKPAPKADLAEGQQSVEQAVEVTEGQYDDSTDK